MVFVPPRDRVLEHSTSNSQTVFTVTGAIDTSFNAFSAFMSVGDTTIGGVVESGVAFRSGTLTYSNTNEITVSTTKETKGTFSAGGTKEVFMGLPALETLFVGAVGFGTVNKFLNGTMDIWQNGTSAIAAAATTVNGYATDGWIVNATYSSGAGPVMSQLANTRTGARTRWLLKILGATNCTDVILKQRIESAVAADFGNQAITVQAQISNATGGSITPTLTVKYPTATDNYASTTTDSTINGVSLQSCADGAVTQVAYTFTPSGNVALGMEVLIDLGNNFSSNAKAVAIGECDIRATPRAASGLNSNPPSPELRPLGMEMPLAQRYLYVLVPGVSAAGVAIGGLSGATNGFYVIRFPVQMFKTPTMSVSAPADWTNDPLQSGTTAQPGTVAAFATTSPFATRLQLTSTSMGSVTSGVSSALETSNTSAKIIADARL